jgi:hypothetical protein
MNYKRIYDQIISRAKARTHIHEYIERHHIVPRCLGGSDEPYNIAYVTPEEHFVCHLLLAKLNPSHRGLLAATVLLSNLNTSQVPGRAKNKLYGWVKRRLYSKPIKNPNCVCKMPGCLKPTYSMHRQFCSMDCSLESRRLNQSDLKAYTCAHCGSSFEDRYQRKYCSQSCSSQSRAKTMRSKTVIDLTCQFCSKSFQRDSRYPGKYCSVSCGAKARCSTSVNS